MRPIIATRVIASEEAVRCSKSWLRRRHLPNQAKARSTIQRFGKATKPVASSGRFTIAQIPAGSLPHPLDQLAGVAAVGPEAPHPRRASAKGSGTSRAPSRSCTLAGCTATPWTNPKVSTTRERLRP